MNDSPAALSEVIEMGWQDPVAFEDILHYTGLSVSETIRLMRAHLKPASYRRWRERVRGRRSKHKTKSTQMRR